jgi:YD repeat-containing protein
LPSSRFNLFTYDANGNTTTEVASSATTTFAWDYENRLTSVTLPGTSGTNHFQIRSFRAPHRESVANLDGRSATMAGEIAEAVSPDVHPKVQTVSGTLARRPVLALTYGILQMLSGELATRDKSLSFASVTLRETPAELRCEVRSKPFD